MPIWQWADQTVRLQSEDAAEPGPYRSAKTPWTRRLQDLIHHRRMHVWNSQAKRWEAITVTEVSIKKSSQSGFSEACLNGVRWHARWRPVNVIYAIDTAEEARKIANRLERSLRYLGGDIFTGDPDDIKTLWFKLRGMDVLFYGSGSPGKFANKQAGLLIADEVEEHIVTKGDTTTLDNLSSRKKTSATGLQVNLSKPKLKTGPITKAHADGNQERAFVPCPHCEHMQPLTFFPEECDTPFSEEMIDILDDQTGEKIARLPVPLPPGERRKMTTGRVVFDHCKYLTAELGWDKLRILRETFYECAACKAAINFADHQRWMLDRLEWRPTVLTGTPGIVSQHINDLYSEDILSSLGNLALSYLSAKEKGLEALTGFYNHRLGLDWSEEANETSASDILDNIAGKPLWLVDAPDSSGRPRRHVFHDEPSAQRAFAIHESKGASIEKSICPPYKRGSLPWAPFPGCPGLILGADVGGHDSAWVAIAVAPDCKDLAVIDWGVEIGPEDILDSIMLRKRYADPAGKSHHIWQGYIDAHYRTKDVYAVCRRAKKMLTPMVGIGGAAASGVKVMTRGFNETFGLHYITFNKQRAHDNFYRDKIKLRRSRLFFPVDVDRDPDFIAQLCAEYQIAGRHGTLVWSDEPSGPNHAGDALENAINGFDFLMRKS